MENITSTGDTRTAVRPVRPLYSLADGLERAAAGGGAGVGICLRAGGLSAGAKLPDYVSSCPGGHVVDGRLSGNGRRRLCGAGLADENGRSDGGGAGAGGRRLHGHRPGQRGGMGETDVGNVVDLGRAPDVGAGFAVSLCRDYRPLARLRRSPSGGQGGRYSGAGGGGQSACHSLFGHLVEHAASRVDQHATVD